MHFDTRRQQWFSNQIRDRNLFGEKMMEKTSVEVIPPGTVMVLVLKGTSVMMFQTLTPIYRGTKDIGLVAYEPGSIMYLISEVRFTPTIKFGNCRMPTTPEYARYSKMKTV